MTALGASGWVTLSGDPDVNIQDKLKKYCQDKRYTLHIGTDTHPDRDWETPIKNRKPKPATV